MKQVNKKIVIISTSVILLLSGAAYVSREKIAGLVKDKANASSVPSFIFDSKVAPRWWAGDNFNIQATVTDDYIGTDPIEKLPVAGRVINQGSREAKPAGGCFVTFSYYDYAVDTEAIKKAKEDSMTAKSQLVLQRGSVRDMTIKTTEGVKAYRLYQYGISGPGSDTVQRGIELGYVKLANGYINIEGVCEEPSLLDSTVSGVLSISLTK